MESEMESDYEVVYRDLGFQKTAGRSLSVYCGLFYEGSILGPPASEKPRPQLQVYGLRLG